MERNTVVEDGSFPWEVRFKTLKVYWVYQHREKYYID